MLSGSEAILKIRVNREAYLRKMALDGYYFREKS